MYYVLRFNSHFCHCEIQPSLCSPLYKAVYCFCSREETHITVIPPWCHEVSSTHVCYYFCLLCIWKQPSRRPAAFDPCYTTYRRSLRPVTAPSPSDVKRWPSGPPWLYTKKTADKTEGWEVPLLQICLWSDPPSPHLWTTTADATSSRRVWQPSCFYSLSVAICSVMTAVQLSGCKFTGHTVSFRLTTHNSSEYNAVKKCTAGQKWPQDTGGRKYSDIFLK